MEHHSPAQHINVLPSRLPRSGMGFSSQPFWLIVIVGECQLMATLIMRGSPVFPLIHQDFRGCHPRLARRHAAVTLNHHKRHADGLYTPPDEHGKIEPTILSVAGQHATRMGRERACRYGPPGPIFLQAAEG